MVLNKVFITEALDKLAIESGHVFQLKMEQEQTVDCLLEGRDIFLPLCQRDMVKVSCFKSL